MVTRLTDYTTRHYTLNSMDNVDDIEWKNGDQVYLMDQNVHLIYDEENGSWWEVPSTGGKEYKVSACFGGSSTNTYPMLLDGRYIGGSSLGSQNYPIYPKTVTGVDPTFDKSNPFKIHLRLKASGRYNNWDMALSGGSGGGAYQPYIELPSADTYIFRAAWTDTSNAQTFLGITSEELPFVANQWYTVEFIFDGENFIFTASDGETTIEKSTPITGPFRVSESSLWCIGGNNTSSFKARTCTFDLADCYWAGADGSIVWGNKL